MSAHPQTRRYQLAPRVAQAWANNYLAANPVIDLANPYLSRN
jgi:DNA-binding IclR family transcriptional regulator